MIIKKKCTYKILIVLICCVTFFCITMPFKQIFTLTDATEIRPAEMLPPVFGMLFGFWGALGCAIGNLAADVIYGYDVVLSLISFMIQLFTSYLVYLLWYNTGKKSSDLLYPGFEKISKLAKFCVIVFISSAINAVLVGVLLEYYYNTEFLSNSTLIIFFNNLDFGIMLGTPAAAFLSRQNIPIIMPKNVIVLKKSDNIKQKISFNEKMIFNFSFAALLLTVMIALLGYYFLNLLNLKTIRLFECLYIFVAAFLTFYFLIVGIFLYYSEKKFLVPIKSISNVVSNYGTNGKLDNKTIVSECERFSSNETEVGDMTAAIIKMLNDIEIYTFNIKKSTAERERMLAELNLASKIQNGILPHSFGDLNTDSVEIAASMVPARVIGGDFYDCFYVDVDHIAFVIADVSGKGVPAAMFMAMTKMVIQMYFDSGYSPEEVLTLSNSFLCSHNEAEMFVTAFVGLLNHKTGELIYANAGHNLPIIIHNNQAEFMQTDPGFVLSGIDGFQYKQSLVRLLDGDTIFLYTDGVTEANDISNKLFGDERLLNIVNRLTDTSPEKIISFVKKEVSIFTDGQEQFDDITMLALRVRQVI